MPRISVIMPAHNAAPFIAASIESIQRQSFADFEFLIHDDGSTDATFAIALSYAGRDKRLHVTTAPCEGVYPVRNRLMSMAKGQYLAVMDADDIAKPDRFLKQIECLDVNPHHAAVGGQVELIDEEGFVLGPMPHPTSHEMIDAGNCSGKVSIPHPTALLRAQAIAEIGGYDESYSIAGDVDLWLRLAEHSRLANLDVIVLQYRINPLGLTATCNAEQKKNIARAIESAAQRRNVKLVMQEKKIGLHTYDTPESRRLMYIRYAWMAWIHGHRATWRRYILRAFRMGPFNRDVIHAAVFGFLKRPRKRPVRQDSDT